MTTSTVRQIEADDVPARYARGWHCLGLASDYRDGQPHAIEAFGKKLVVWSSSAGLHVLDAYCRHMGGDLSQGQVKDDALACPFHDWRWRGDGRCGQIPYAKRIPPRARTVSWPTAEQDGLLFVWNDPEGNPPTPDAAIPHIAGAGSEEWTDWLWYTTRIDGANCREVIDNVVDMAHFFYVHKSYPTYFKNIFEGHTATQIMNGTGRADVSGQGGSSTSVAAYYGPSFMIDELTQHTEHGDIESVLINCHYPVDANSFVLQYGLLVKRPHWMPPDAAEVLARKTAEFIKLGFEQDVAIWRSKARIDNPLLCEEDGPVYQLRRWYQQFYVDVADIEPEMTERFEFEIDTTRPNDAWQQEVERNLATQGSSIS